MSHTKTFEDPLMPSIGKLVTFVGPEWAGQLSKVNVTFYVEPNISLLDFITIAKSVFGISPPSFKLTWKDEEGDAITVCTDKELQEALQQPFCVEFNFQEPLLGNMSSICMPNIGNVAVKSVHAANCATCHKAIIGIRFRRCNHSNSIDWCVDCFRNYHTTAQTPQNTSSHFFALLKSKYARFSQPCKQEQVPPKQETTRSTTTTTTTTSSSKTTVIVTHNATCDICKEHIVDGTRYKCVVCADYDLCEKCEDSDYDHDKTHPFLKLRYPVAAETSKLVRPLLPNIRMTHKEGMQHKSVMMKHIPISTKDPEAFLAQEDTLDSKSKLVTIEQQLESISRIVRAERELREKEDEERAKLQSEHQQKLMEIAAREQQIQQKEAATKSVLSQINQKRAEFEAQVKAHAEQMRLVEQKVQQKKEELAALDDALNQKQMETAKRMAMEEERRKAEEQIRKAEQEKREMEFAQEQRRIAEQKRQEELRKKQALEEEERKRIALLRQQQEEKRIQELRVQQQREQAERERALQQRRALELQKQREAEQREAEAKRLALEQAKQQQLAEEQRRIEEEQRRIAEEQRRIAEEQRLQQLAEQKRMEEQKQLEQQRKSQQQQEAREQIIRQCYAQELQSILSMGFADDARTLQLLSETEGNVERVIEKLLE